MVSLLLAFMTTSGIAGWLNIQGLQCIVSFPEEIYSGIPTEITVRITNHKRFIPSYLLELKVFGEVSRIGSIAPNGSAEASVAHTFGKRGQQCCASALIRSPFPVNYFVRGVECYVNKECVAFPFPRAVRMETFANKGSETGPVHYDGRGFDGEIRTIADYSGVEPLRMIHWRLSARHDRFKVKQLSESLSEPVVIDLGAVSGIPIETLLSQAVCAVNSLARENRPVGLRIPPDRFIPAACGRHHRLKLLTELALHDQP